MRWEYRTITVECRPLVREHLTVDSSHEQRLNEMGSEGWELVSAMPIPNVDTAVDAIVYVLKRPIDELSPTPARLRA